MIDKFLTNEYIKLVESVENWREGIKISAEPLLKSNIINESYVEAMIENVNENGNYIIMVPKVAMPHARSEYGALGIGMSVLKVNKPVMFPQETPVNIFITIASNSNDQHLDLLSHLTLLLSNQTYIDDLLSAKTQTEIINIFERI